MERKKSTGGEMNLLPCPFCGNDFILPSEVHDVREQLRQWCDHCGAYGPPGYDDQEAHDKWNLRNAQEEK